MLSKFKRQPRHTDWWELTLNLIAIAVIIFIMGLGIALLQHYRWLLHDAPCLEWAGYTMGSIPVRCVEYFTEGH